MDADGAGFELRLCPLRTVLFPAGRLRLKVVEARYLDMITACARQGQPFGAVAWTARDEALGDDGRTALEAVGTMARVLSADALTPGSTMVHCEGLQRFRIRSRRRDSDGVWTAVVGAIAADALRAPPASQVATVRALAAMIAQLRDRDRPGVTPPYRFDDAGWVANRWCEILPIPQLAKQRLMELADPVMRLQLVDDYLRQHGVLASAAP